MLHLKWLSSALLLLMLAGGVNGQDSLTLAKRPDPQQVATAKETIRSAAQAPTLLAHQGYAIIDIKLESELESYIVPGSDDCLRTVSIPKGKGYAGWLVSKGDTAAKWTVIEPITTHDRLLVTGIANGTATVIWHGIVNGKSAVIAAFQFIVGKPVPKPDDPPPPDDPLVKSFRNAMALDVAANKADKKHLLALSGIYDAASKDSLDSLATMNDLDARLVAARTSAGIPDPDVMYPNLRKAVQAELYSQLGVNATSGMVELKVDTRRLAKAAMAKIATSLTEVAK